LNLPIYLDNNATTRVDKAVLQEMLPFFCDKYYNPSSNYEPAQDISNCISNARRKVADLLGANHPGEIIFTSGGTENANFAIRGILKQNPYKKDKNSQKIQQNLYKKDKNLYKKGKNSERQHIITTKVEHHCVLNTYKDLESQGYDVTYLNVDSEGNLDLEELKNSIRPETLLVSAMWANNETGVVFPVEQIAEITKEINPETLVFVDAVQAAGKIPINVKDTKIDMLSVSGHKIHAPKGIGALYIRRGTSISSIIAGGHQEKSLRPGTENITGIIGLGRAAELALENLEDKTQRIKNLRNRLETGILQRCFNAKVNGAGANRICNTSNISFDYLESELILLQLQNSGILASSGSACTSGSLEPSHVLEAMGLNFTQANSSIRFSLGKYTTEQEIDYVIEKVSGIINRMISASPYQEELSRLKEESLV